MRVFVSCINKDKGGIARKNCSVACIGCGKCVKICPFDAITLENSLAYIDFNKCKLLRKCLAECPTGAILEVGFPARKPVAENASTGTAKPAADVIKKEPMPKADGTEKSGEQGKPASEGAVPSVEKVSEKNIGKENPATPVAGESKADKE